MSLWTRLAASVSHDSGAILVTVALFAPVLLLMAAFTMDTGDWLMHKRHLQVQADAAVFAAAREFQPCFTEAARAATNNSIYGYAGQYAGTSAVTPPKTAETVASFSPVYNKPVGGVSEGQIHAKINSKTYYSQASPVDSTVVEQPPCEASMVDAKLTESEPPWYWKLFATSPVQRINAHARIEILQEKNPAGLEPLAVTESSPVAVEAYFVNEDNKNAVIAKAALAKIGTAEGHDVWANSTAPLAVPLAKTNAATAHIGVVVALTGQSGQIACGEHYVECFGQKVEREKASLEHYEPILHIAGYSTAGKGTVKAPLARQVTLSAGTCTDGYFSTSAATCSFTIAAKLDYGSAVTKGITVTPLIGGTKEKTTLSFNAGTGTWTGTASLPAGSGSKEVSLVVECKKEAGSPCEKEAKSTSATIADVQRTFAASEARSGPISGAWLSEVGGLPQDADSFEVCESCTHKLVVTVDVRGSIEDARNYNDPLFHMRFGNPTAEVVGCEPGKEASGAAYRENLSIGCAHSYIRNTSDPSCTSTTEPFDCFGKASGVKTGPFEQGLEERFVSHPPEGKKFYCPNNWVEPPGGGLPVIPSDDSRVITLFVEPYAANGTSSTPIQDFATFYVTGWNKSDPCDSKAAPTHPDDSALKGEIVGHFIKYVNTVGKGEGGEAKCSTEPSQLGPCVAVLTR